MSPHRRDQGERLNGASETATTVAGVRARPATSPNSHTRAARERRHNPTLSLKSPALLRPPSGRPRPSLRAVPFQRVSRSVPPRTRATHAPVPRSRSPPLPLILCRRMSYLPLLSSPRRSRRRSAQSPSHRTPARPQRRQATTLSSGDHRSQTAARLALSSRNHGGRTVQARQSPHRPRHWHLTGQASRLRRPQRLLRQRALALATALGTKQRAGVSTAPGQARPRRRPERDGSPGSLALPSSSLGHPCSAWADRRPRTSSVASRAAVRWRLPYLTFALRPRRSTVAPPDDP